MKEPSLILATSARGASGGLAAAAALGIAAAERGEGGGALLVEAGAPARGRGPTVLASEGARSLEADLRTRMPGARVAARGRLCWLCLDANEAVGELRALIAEGLDAEAVVAYLPAAEWERALNRVELAPCGGLVRADLPRDRALAALAVAELHERELRARVAPRPPGRVAARRALAGIDPGGETSRRAARWARGLLGERGQALPLVLGACFVLVFCALLLVAIGGAVTGKGRLQRAADLAAVSAARSMRDDVDRLLAPPRLPDGRPNPAHMGRPEYLGRARDVARLAAERNGVPRGRLRVTFPDRDSFAPLRVRTRARSHVRRRVVPGKWKAARSIPKGGLKVAASAEAEAVAPAGYSGAPEVASGGGYSGPLAYRQGKPMRPDVAAAFDHLAEAARRTGVAVTITSAFRSDAEQAELFARNPDPRWVAPPGKSLHRCATELDLGPPAAYAWLAANAPRFGFVKRYSWEPWHFGLKVGPAPCSRAGNALAGGSGADGRSAGSGGGLPAFVPAAYRAPILRAASRSNVSAAVLAAQLLAESNFNPHAVSPAGAQGIAQFMPGTAAAYGLRDPFDPAAAIDAQARLMADLLAQFRSLPLALAAYNAGPGAVAPCGCIPPYAETQGYVARILSLLDGAGELAVPPLEVRLVS